MENNVETTEYANEIELLKQGASSVSPSRESLQALLAKIPAPISSPYAPKVSPFWSFQKIAVAMLVVVVAISGGTFFFKSNTSTNSVGIAMLESTPSAMPSFDGGDTSRSAKSFSAPMAGAPTAMMMTGGTSGPSEYISPDNSDQGLVQDQQAIDAQMAALNADTMSASTPSS